MTDRKQNPLRVSGDSEREQTGQAVLQRHFYVQLEKMIFFSSHILVLCFVPVMFTSPCHVCSIITLFSASILSFNSHQTFIYL